MGLIKKELNEPIGNTWNLFDVFFGFKVKAHINALESIINSPDLPLHIEPETCGKMELHLQDWKAFYKKWVLDCGACPMTNFGLFNENPEKALADIIHSSHKMFKTYLSIRIKNHDYEECRDGCNAAILEYKLMSEYKKHKPKK